MEMMLVVLSVIWGGVGERFPRIRGLTALGAIGLWWRGDPGRASSGTRPRPGPSPDPR